MRRLGVILGLLVAIAGITACASSDVPDSVPRTFELAVPGDDVVLPSRLVVDDRTGLVTMAQAQLDPGFDAPEGVSNPPGNLRRLVVRWLGAWCDLETIVRVEPVAGGLSILENTRLEEEICFPDGQPPVVVLDVPRWVVLDVSVAVPADAVSFERGVRP